MPEPTKSLPVPLLFSETNREGASANARRIMLAAVEAGWSIESWRPRDYFTLRKTGRGYVRLVLSTTGRIVVAATQRRNIETNTASVLAHLQGRGPSGKH